MYEPKPTGKYYVGTLTFSIVDENRIEQLGPNAGNEKRKIAARVFYPTRPTDTVGLDKGFLLSREVAKQIGKEYFIKINYEKQCAEGKNTAEYYPGAPHVPGEKYPLIFYNHGYKSYIEGNSFLCIELASQGYVVISVGHAHEALATKYEDGSFDISDPSLMKRMTKPLFPGYLAMFRVQKQKGTFEEQYRYFHAVQEKYCGFLIERQKEWEADTLAILAEAKKRFDDFIDFEAGIGVTGHSMGGSTAYALCQNTPEITCGINIDGGLFGEYGQTTMTKPFFQICSEPNVSAETKPMLNTTAPVYRCIFKRIKHIAFADVKFFVASDFVTGKIPEKLTHETLVKCHLDFFDKYLKQKEIEIQIPENEFISFEKF